MGPLGPIEQAIADHLGGTLETAKPLHGGDLSEVRLLTLSDGRTCVAKIGPLVAREAGMLRAIRATGAPAPAVLGVSGQVMLIQALDQGAATGPSWQALGRGLGQLHATTGPHYGWDDDYAFGSVAIPNQPLPNWPDFWAQRRLMANPAALPADIARRVEALAKSLPDRLPRHPPAALLHGDLWAGNVLFTTGGNAYMIDPASYYGDGEVDLAMLCLFARPPDVFYLAYGRPEADLAARRAIYQLWPALVHLRLFGSGYRGMVETMLEATGV